MRDFVELEKNIDFNYIDRFILKLEKLKKCRVDTSKIISTDTIRILASKNNILPEILEQEGLELNYNIGNAISRIKTGYRKESKNSATEEQAKRLKDEFGIILQEIDHDEELLEKLEILKKHGVTNFAFGKKDTVRIIANKNNIDPQKLEENGLNLDEIIGNTIDYRKRAFKNNNKNCATEEQIKRYKEEFGIIFEERDFDHVLLELLEKLQKCGIDTTKIDLYDTIRILANKNNIDSKVLEEEGIDLDEAIGMKIQGRKNAFRKSRKNCATEEQVKRYKKEFGIDFKKRDIDQEVLEELQRLQKCGIDTSSIKSKDTVGELAQKNNIAYKKIEDEGFELDYAIGYKIEHRKKAYRAKSKNCATEEQAKRYREEFGIELELIDRDVNEELLEKLEILQKCGIDTSSIKSTDTIERLIERNNVDIEILENEGIKKGYKIGQAIWTAKRVFGGKLEGTKPTKEQVKRFKEKFGIDLEYKDRDVNQEVLEVLEKLHKCRVQTSNIRRRDTIEKIAEKSNIDIEIFKREGFKPNDKIGALVYGVINRCRGKEKGRKPTEEQRKRFEEEFGISLEYKEIFAQDIGQAGFEIGIGDIDKFDEAEKVLENLVEKEKEGGKNIDE